MVILPKRAGCNWSNGRRELQRNPRLKARLYGTNEF